MTRLLVAAAVIAVARAQNLDLTVANDGKFQISMDGKPWLTGGETQAGGFSSSAKTLTPSAPKTSTGTDKLGAYKATTLEWSGGGSMLMATSFRTYVSDPATIVFEQLFPAGLEGAGRPLSDEARSVALDAAIERAGTGQCRVVTANDKLHGSSKGFNAWTVNAQGNFTEHENQFCDCTGKDNCATWAYHAESVTLASCEAKCTELKCKCMDFSAGGGGHHKPPHHGPSGPAAQTIFPGFDREPEAAAKDCFSYHGVFPQMGACTTASYKESHMGGVPLVIYDGKNTSLPMSTFSPLNQPMASHMGSDASFFGAGVKATVTHIPAGWSQLFILTAGRGVNEGMMGWGDRMLKFTDKPRADMYKDLTHSTIGFWTDNGGFYHYATGEQPCKPGNCPSYETVIPKVKAYHDSIGVPFRHWQFDSWFYPKDSGVNAGGGGGAVTNWTADPNIFPSGMVAIQDKLKLPIVMHNRQWSDRSDYVNNSCQRSAARLPPENSARIDSEPCEWYKDKDAVPADPINFFTWFFTQQDGWGLSMYEQDWMCTEYDGVEHLQTNISMGDLWLEGMAVGAASSNRSIQYCMPYANQVLSAAAYPAVTNARATGDYFHAKDQWAVGGTSLFYWAIGILPFKDGFYSSTNKQVGGQTVGPESQPDREALMATLSGAMVGPMDGINLLNKSRTMTACRSDGYILKPDKPVSTTDACFRTGHPTCHTFHTYSDVKTNQGHQRVHYHFNSPAGPMTADMVYLKGSEEYIVYNWYTAEVTKLAPTVTLAPGYEGNNYAVVSPLVGGWAFIGETDKYVPASTLRFPAVAYGSGDTNAPALTVSVKGLTGETVKVCAAEGVKLVCQMVKFSADATKAVSFPSAATGGASSY